MVKIFTSFVYMLSLSLILNIYTPHAQKVDDISLGTYIVHVSKPKNQTLRGSQNLETYYKSFLPKASVSSNNPSPILIYSYKHVASGFAAKLTKAHLKYIEKRKDFLSAYPQEILALQTTHTPNFLGLHQKLGVWQDSNYGKGVIIGFLDTGIISNHPSFNDEGVPPPSKKWKGKCDYAEIVCNNKIIGAKSFLSGFSSGEMPDPDGHGTHTSSTATGNFVNGANAFGQANGTAVGMAPLAHVAMYQVCTSAGCSNSDFLAGMDAAIEDGVDILSISIGGPAKAFFLDTIALAAFPALQKGISVICAAGNSGPSHATIKNGAPWILTVGASTVDRKIRSTAVLGNQKQYAGETLYQPSNFSQTPLPLVYSGPHSEHCTYFGGTEDIKGKVVLCEQNPYIWVVTQGKAVKEAGGLAIIIMNDEANAYSTSAEPHVLPAVLLSYAAGLKIKEYLNSTSSPTATISFQGTVIGDKTAPVVASFSSRGPNKPSPGILKPDIIGPGVNVLAAWPFSADNTTGTTFNIISGTSMSCPHLSGITALLKSAHPNWSPAAIKSAIMTTADINNLEDNLILDEKLHPADMFAVGAGHVNASRASDPGIIYDLTPEDYVSYLCGLNYTDKEVEIITHSVVNCSKVTVIPEAGLNYPSFSLALGVKNLTYLRTVTNVGPANSVYRSLVINPPGVEVFVEPKTLKFSKENEKLKYRVTFGRSSSVPNETYVQGYLVWQSDTRKNDVRSPLSVQLT